MCDDLLHDVIDLGFQRSIDDSIGGSLDGIGLGWRFVRGKEDIV